MIKKGLREKCGGVRTFRIQKNPLFTESKKGTPEKLLIVSYFGTLEHLVKKNNEIFIRTMSFVAF